MRYVFRGLSFLLIPILVNGIFTIMRRPRQSEKGKVYLHDFLGLLGIIATAFFLVLAIVSAFSDEPLWVLIIFFMAAALGSTMIIGFVNCRISYDEEGFVAKNFFGIKRRFTYDQVTAIKENTHERYLYMGSRRVMVDEFAIGGKEFIQLVKKKYRTMHDGKSLPKIQKTKHDIFNGNVHDAGGFLFAYILVGIVVVGLLGLSVYSAYFTSSNTSNTIKQSVSFISCKASNKEIVLISKVKQTYFIEPIDDQFDMKAIQAICDGETIVTTYSTEVTPRDEEPYFDIKAITHQGTYIVSFEETNQLHRKESTKLVIVVAGLCLIWGAVVGCSIVVGRNPKKFSKRFVRLFFKDGYIKY